MSVIVAKKVVLSFLLWSVLAISPVFSQMITTDSSRLEQIINEEVAKRIGLAVDSAVAEAIKAEELKYLPIIADKEKYIVELLGTIDKQKNQIALLEIQNKNLIADFNFYKSQHGWKRDIAFGGAGAGAGIVAAAVIYIIFVH
jgi:uncharacterized FlgJ-related protein